MMKKTVMALCFVFMAFVFGGCGGKGTTPASAEPAIPTQPLVMMSATPEAPEAQAAAEEGCTVEANGYRIDVLSAEQGTDYFGNPVAIVKYLFTNNNSSPASFWEVAKDTVSQNGVSMSNEGVVVDGAEFYTFTQPVSNGQSVAVQYAYPLSGSAAPLNVTIAVYNYSVQATLASSSCTLTIK